MDNRSDPETISLKQWASLVSVYLLVPVILLGLGRDPAWTQAWVFTAVIMVVAIGGHVLAERYNPGLMAERLSARQRPGVKVWDKVLGPLSAISLLYPQVIVAGLDHYHGWTSPFPLWVQIAAFVLILLGYALTTWAITENRFFSVLVRIQTERGHVVCDTGPYRYIRHPGYAGDIIASFLITFLLNSWWVMIPALIAFMITVIRTVLEDKTLLHELPGYTEYAQRVRYRLLPGLW